MKIARAVAGQVTGQIAGMIGGLGPESTAIYYRWIIAEFRKSKRDGSYPSIFINSINMQRMLDRNQIDGMILGGTELSLLFEDDTAHDIPLLDTTKIHVQAIVAEMLE